VSYPLDRGEWNRALTALSALEQAGAAVSGLQAASYRATRLGLHAEAGDLGVLPELREFTASQTSQAQSPDDPDHDQALFAALYGAAMSARLGDTVSARKSVNDLSAKAIASGYPALADMLAIAQAEMALAGKASSTALAALQPRLTGEELYQLHETLLRVYRQQGDFAAGLREAKWLTSHRGRAYLEWNSMYILQPANVMNSNLAMLSAAELAVSAGNEELARDWLGKFDDAWPKAKELLFLRPRLQALRSALN